VLPWGKGASDKVEKLGCIRKVSNMSLLGSLRGSGDFFEGEAHLRGSKMRGKNPYPAKGLRKESPILEGNCRGVRGGGGNPELHLSWIWG